MKLLFGSHSMQGSQDEPFSKLTRIEVSPINEDSQEMVLLQFLRQQPELLVFTMMGVKGEWRLKRIK